MRQVDLRFRRAARVLRLKPGDLFEDCAYHPVLCLGVNYKTDEIWGVSLIDGSDPRACSLLHCGVRKLTAKEAWRIKMKGPSDREARDRNLRIAAGGPVRKLLAMPRGPYVSCPHVRHESRVLAGKLPLCAALRWAALPQL